MRHSLPLSENNRMNAARFACGCILLLAISDASAQRFGGGPFAGLSGPWSGSGIITMADGESERIRCRATYAVQAAGRAMSQNLHCASPSYRLEIVAHIVSNGGSISGSWSETTRGISGSVSGHAMGPSIEARVMGGAFAANVRIRTRGSSQFVGITPQAGTDVATVAITMRRG